jgi:hypothetical protein
MRATKRQIVGWVEPFAKPIAVAPSMMGIAYTVALGTRADAVAPPILRSETEFNGIGGLLTYIGMVRVCPNRRR